MLSYHQIESTNFQGVVVVFAREQVSGDIYYNVLGEDVDINDDNLKWSGFMPVEFTKHVRQVGMSIITFDIETNTMQPGDDPFRVITDQKYISVIQQSTKGSLYINRFCLRSKTEGKDQKKKTYTLVPAWEVRYARSHKEDVPADASDTQEYIDPDGQPFLEPSLELSMISKCQGGAFDVLLLPVSGKETYSWQFFIWNETKNCLNLYNFPATKVGLFDITEKTINADYKIDPDSCFSIAYPKVTDTLTINGPPRATTYTKHENVVQPDGRSIGVQRASRVLITVPVSASGKTSTAVIDSAVGLKGTLAKLEGPTVVSSIKPAEFDLTFDGMSSVKLTQQKGSPLSIKGPYSMKFMISPKKLADDVWVIGEQETVDPKKQSPFVKIVKGSKIEVGFGTGSDIVKCQTLKPVLGVGVWAIVQIDYKGAGDNPFAIKVNGSAVSLSTCTTATEPCGTAVDLIGNPAKGLTGALNSLEISVGGKEIVSLACNTVDYSKTPPTTPNSASKNVTAQVYGAKLEPSTSPVNIDMSGEFNIDGTGLTYYAGLAEFINPASSASLLDASDGLLHLYYKGMDTQFSVAQFLKESSRATFYVEWTTTGKSEQLMLSDGGAGVMNFIAHRVGTYMNDCKITVTPSGISKQLCDITVTASNDVGVEKWTGLPRDINQLSLIWNGVASTNPDDQGVLDGKKPFFDYKQNIPSVLMPNTEESTSGYFMFTSVPSLSLGIATVGVAAGSTGDFVNVDISLTKPPHWEGDGSITQSWPEVPAGVKASKSVFDGKSNTYDYSNVVTQNTKAYGLMTVSGRSDDQVGNISVFVKDTLPDFTMKVENGSENDFCNITICGVKLTDVPREQNSCAEILNGLSSGYKYPENYKTTIAAKIFAMTNGLTAYVINTQTAIVAGAWAYAGLLRLIYTGGQNDTGNIGVITLTEARTFQGATLDFKGGTKHITGSRLFGCVIASQPTNGGAGKILDTSAFDNSKAPLLMQGANGGWMTQTPKFCIETNTQKNKNYVDFNIDKSFSPSDKLAILSDMTLELWVNPDEQGGAANNRMLTYNVEGNIDHPTEPVRYMAGSMQGPGLFFNDSTYVQSSFNFSPPDLTVQIYVKLNEGAKKGIVWTVSQIMGGTEYLRLALDRYSRPVLDFMNGAGTVQGSGLTYGKWTCLTATVTKTAKDKVDISLYVDTGEPKTASVQSGFSQNIGLLMLGKSTGGCEMSANGVAFWQRALSVGEVKNTVLYGFEDNDDMLGIRWNLTEGTGTTIYNSAATGRDYDAKLVNGPSKAWDEDGAFHTPYSGRNDYILKSEKIIKNWMHVAMASTQGYALDLNGATSGSISDGSPFNPSEEFAIEAWVKTNVRNAKQVIVEKTGSYSLYINTHGQVCLSVSMSQAPVQYGYPPTNFTFDLAKTVDTGKTTYIAVNFKTGTVDNQKGSKDFVDTKYYIDAALYINGVKVESQYKEDYSKTVSIKNEKSSFYVGIGGDKTFNLQGLIANIRIWGRRLSDSEISETYTYHLPVTSTDGLIAGWDFAEQTGKYAKDILQNNDLLLTNNQMWSIWQDLAYSRLYVNGHLSRATRVSVAETGGYQDMQFTIGGMLKSSKLTLPYSGGVDDVRLFSTKLTEQQIRESMNKALTGYENNLAAYWKIDAGSGQTIYDMTGRGNNGILMPQSGLPKWQSSTSPIQNEAEVVVNILGGVSGHRVADINSQPSVIEYASSEKDAYGNIFSVMKRGYFYETTTGKTVLKAGYKVGDLDTVYVGQVQTKPSIVGYIEGGPPIPSENQTLAYWNGVSGNPPNKYSTSSSVTYAESETRTWSFKSNETSAFTGAFNIKGGYYQKAEAGASAGLGAEANVKFVKQEMNIGAKASLSGDIGGGSDVLQSHSNTTSLTSILTPSGEWEQSDNILNPTVGRRYIQNNLAMAVVKSATADLFMMALKGTQTPVGYSVIPNKNIPVDTNIIDFPINPKYIKNGTLDGKVGLVNDPDYPNANKERGSYFKPVEAYALKRRIEKEEQQIKAFYENFSQSRYSVLGSMGSVKDKLKENTAYDFSKNLNQRSLYNNYVWSAGGGLRKEELSVANSYSESYTGMSSLKFAIGAEFKLKFGTPAGGFYLETDAMLGGSFTMTASKTEATANGFSLKCTVDPTEFLSAPIIKKDSSGKLIFEGYTDNPVPGKVDGYRYMSFLLAPSQENFTTLKSTIIDQNWLNNSTSAAAIAMREAVSAENGPWRILYRTTYVSRVPAPFQPTKDDTNAPNITLPANLPSNSWLISIIEKKINKADPSPSEIGTALDAVLGKGSAGEGILNGLIPWWASFYKAAQVYGTKDFKELSELREDLLQYMKNKYEAEKYFKQ